MSRPLAIAGRFPQHLVVASTLLGSTALAELPAPDGVEASDGTSTLAVDVEWIGVDGAIGYRVLRAVGDEPFEEIASTPDTLHRDVTAAIGVSYRYRIVAFDDVETSAASEIDLGWRNTVAPAAFTASDGTVGGGVELAWSASEAAIAYRVYRINGNGNAPPQEIGETEATTFLDDSSPNGQVRTYTARAVTAAGLSDFAAPDSGFAGLSAPQNLRASDGQFSRWVFLRWNPVPQSDGYRVLRAAEGEAEIEIGTSNAPVLKDESALPGVIYTYRVAAIVGDGVTATSMPDEGWRGLPRPTSLFASDGESTTQIDLSWPEIPGATAYRLLRSTPGTPWETFVEVGANAFTDTVSPAGLQIHYRLVALVGDLASRPSAPETGWRNVEAPTGLSASDGTHPDRVEVSWNAAPDPAVLGYEVYRRLPTDPEGIRIGSVEGEDATVFDDFEIDPGVIGTYWVCAVVKPGCSAGSDSDTGFRGTGSGFAGSVDGGSGATSTLAGPGVSNRADDAGGPDGGAGSSDVPRPDTSLDLAGADDATAPPADADPASSPLEDESDVIDAAIADDLADDCAELLLRLEMLFALGLVEEPVGASAFGDDSDPVATPFDPCAIWRGDLDGDGDVDDSDLIAFLKAVERDDPIRGDLDRDGVVGPLDAIRMLGRLGTCSDLRPHELP